MNSPERHSGQLDYQPRKVAALIGTTLLLAAGVAFAYLSGGPNNNQENVPARSVNGGTAVPGENAPAYDGDGGTTAPPPTERAGQLRNDGGTAAPVESGGVAGPRS